MLKWASDWVQLSSNHIQVKIYHSVHWPDSSSPLEPKTHTIVADLRHGKWWTLPSPKVSDDWDVCQYFLAYIRNTLMIILIIHVQEELGNAEHLFLFKALTLFSHILPSPNVTIRVFVELTSARVIPAPYFPGHTQPDSIVPSGWQARSNH